MNIDNYFEKLKLNGSKFELEFLIKMKNELKNYIKKDYSFSDISEFIVYDLKESTEELLYNNEVVTCINVTIYLNNSFLLNIIGGYKNRDNKEKINFETYFDIASITKLYTGLLLIKLKKLNLIDFKSYINDLTNSFKLDSYSIDDLINMAGIIKTPMHLSRCQNREEALKILRQIYIENNDKSIYNYTDMGLIVLTFILEEIFNMSYDEIINEYLLSPLNLKATYHPYNNVTGNGRYDNKPNDPKANILNSSIASAGIFTNTQDLITLSKEIFSFKNYSFEDLKKFCINRTEKPKGIFGSYTKHPLGLVKSYVPNEYSNYSFAFEGFTGSIVVFDLVNKLSNIILVNSLYDNTFEKHPSFNSKLNLYQHALSYNSIKLLILNDYFKEEQNFVKKIVI